MPKQLSKEKPPTDALSALSALSAAESKLAEGYIANAGSARSIAESMMGAETDLM